MITIITGPVNCGKSSYLHKWYLREPKGCGVLGVKTYRGKTLVSYNLLLLPSLILKPICGGSSRSPFQLRHHRFFFNPAAFSDCEKWIKAWVKSQGGPCWIDEIGGLELAEQGFFPLLSHLLGLETEIRAVFNEKYLDDLIARFDIDRYKLIQL